MAWHSGGVVLTGALTVPPAVVDAVVHVLGLSSAIDLDSNDADLRELACDVLEAAVPLITAAERDRLTAGGSGEEPIPDGWPTRAAYWRKRWLWAMEKLDEEAAQRLSLHARICELEAAAAERARICALLGSDHYVIFTADRWTIEHSVECRLSGHMHECLYYSAVSLITAGFDPEMAGRWRINGIDSEGLPSLVRSDTAQP